MAEITINQEYIVKLNATIETDLTDEEIENLIPTIPEVFKEMIIEEITGGVGTVDVEPVKHGHWIFKKRIKLVPTRQTVVAEDGAALALKKHITVKVPYCSICGEHGDCEEDATPYCPDCGAKMDGKEVQE